MSSMSSSWRATYPTDAATWLRNVGHPWWIAGGWAIDLFVGATERPHNDLDVGIFRRDAPAILSTLEGWEIFEAKDRVLRPLRAGAAPGSGVNSLWCRRAGAPEWLLELLLDDRMDERWVFRRQPRITRPVADFLRRNAEGLAPEIQLLYKAKAPRPHDQYDFERTVPHLEREAAQWLQHALHVTHPRHPWIASLEASMALKMR